MSPASRPEPLALLPWLTITLMAPVGATFPVMMNAVSPALASTPCEIRTG